MADTQAEIKVALDSLNKSVEGLKAHNLRQANTLSQILGVMNDQTSFIKNQAAEDEFKEDVAKGDKGDKKAEKANQEAVKTSKNESKKTKGFLSKIGGIFSGAGMGAAAAIGAVGLAAAGIALVVVSITKLIEVMSNLDAGMIKEKVVTLLSIAGEVEKDGKSFIGEGSKFFLAMVGIGLGLLVFGLGAGVAGLTIRLVREGFAEKVLHIVTKLMEIPDKLGGAEKALKDGGTFGLVMMGIGLGLLVFGVGQAVASLTIRLAQEGFAEKVVHIVTTLMGIPAALGGNLETLKAGGTFTLIMMGIGVGLAVFGAGLTVAALVVSLTDSGFADKVLTIVKSLMGVPAALGDPAQTLKDVASFTAIMLGIGAGLLVFGAGLGLATLASELTDSGFAQNVVDIVTKLLSVNDVVGGIGGAFEKGGTFIVAMLGIAIGLYIFAVGSIAGKIGTLVGGKFADNVVYTVTTLLSINKLFDGVGDTFKEAGLFIVTMLGIAAGLALFAIGTAATGIATLIAGDFAQKTVDTVATLLTIAKLPMLDTAIFIGMMAGIAAGLLVFSIGEASAGISSFIGKGGTGGKGVAESIRDKVGILMKIAEDADMTKVENLKLVLDGMREAIGNFTGNIFQALGQNIKQALTNKNTPLDNIIAFAQSADDLEKGTTALERLTEAVKGFGRALSDVKGAGFKSNLKDFSSDLQSVSSTIHKSLNTILEGKGIPATRSRALESLAAVNVGSEGLATMQAANAAANPPSNTYNITNAMENHGGTTNIFNDAGSIDPTLLQQALNNAQL